MKEKRRTEVCEGEKDEKGTKWRGRKPMSPNLIKEPRQASLNMYVLCVQLSSRQTPMSLEQTSAAAATQTGWQLRPLQSRYGMSQLGVQDVRQKSEFSRPRPPTPAASYSGPGRRDKTNPRSTGPRDGRHSAGSSRALTGRDTLILTAVPHASLRSQILKNQVRGTARL